MESSKGSKWDHKSPDSSKKHRSRDKHYSRRDDSGDRYSNRDNNKRSRNKSRDSDDDRHKNYKRSSRDEDHYERRDQYERRDFKKKKSQYESHSLKQEKSPEWGKPKVKEESKPKVEKEKPNFGLSGKLTEDTNTVNGVTIKYSEPQNARKPKRRWRLYPFKGDKALPVLYIHRQSGYLMGRDRKICDIPLDHPSVSKQHAALQFRLVTYTRESGQEGKRVRPYIIDLDSANGTFVNEKKIEPKRYVELLERDVVKFGFSSREYVLLHEHSKDDELDDDVENET